MYFWILIRIGLTEILKFHEKFLTLIIKTKKNEHTARGRPCKLFSECKLRSRISKTKELLETKSCEEICAAAEMTLRALGKRDAANIVKEISTGPAQVAIQIKKARIRDASKPIKYTNEEALAYYLDACHSVHTYTLTQTQAKQRQHDLYPPYYVIRQTKELCYPPQDNISISETFAEIKLQAIIDCTVKR